MSGFQFWVDLFKNQWFTTIPYPTTDFSGQTIIVTGANVGLGLEAARHFVRLHATKVILACRSTSKGEDAKRDIEASTQRPDTCEVWPLDLSSYESVKAFAARATRELARIDIVLESAGVATGSFALVEGNESTLTTNVVSTYLLALLLLPKLKSVGQKYNVRPTVTIVTSDTHVQPAFEERKAPQGKIFEALNTEKGANMGERYPLSKLLEILAGREIVRRHPQPYPVVLNLVNPGFCHSSLMREMHLVGLVMKYIFGARSTEQGSRTYVQAVAMGPESHGKYMSNARIEDPSAFVRSEDGAETGRR
ncbi:short-chain dehydrogenase/reductase-like protein, partial [Viridothelium virens]